MGFKVNRWQTSVRCYAALLLAVLAFAPRLFAAGDTDDYWLSISKRLVIGRVMMQLTNEQIHVTGSNLNVKVHNLFLQS